MSELIGNELGAYRIIEFLGAGGMSTVYKAYHATLERHVAIKVMPEQMGLDDVLRQRFQQEVRVIASLQHAHILPIFDYGEDRGRLYLVMRYIEAGNLEDRLADDAMNLDEISLVVHQVGAALAHAHHHGVVHRDIKPSNVLIDTQGDCYLSDFGLAKTMEASLRLTASGVGMGTPAYMSPEQGQGDSVDARSDVYALGVMLYEMVTGQVPFRASTPVAVAIKHITEPVPLPSSVKPDLSDGLEQVILKSLAKDPEERFQSVQEMVQAFDAAVGREAQPTVLLPGVSVSRKKRRPPVWALAVAGAGLVGLIVLAVLLGAWRGRENTRATETAAALAIAWTAQARDLSATPLPSPTPSFTPVPSATPVPSPTSTSTATRLPTATPTPTATHTPTVSPTPTWTPTQTPTQTPTYTPTPTPTRKLEPTPTPTPAWLLAAELLAPPLGTTFVGWNAEVILRWSAVEGVLEDDYYVVRIPYDVAGNVAEFWRKETSMRVPAIFSSSAVGFPARNYNWTVQVMRCTENCDRVVDDNVKKKGSAVGQKSATGLFYWQPDVGGAPPTPSGTRTRTP
jgi:serine/threonine-protein kinase